MWGRALAGSHRNTPAAAIRVMRPATRVAACRPDMKLEWAADTIVAR